MLLILKKNDEKTECWEGKIKLCLMKNEEFRKNLIFFP